MPNRALVAFVFLLTILPSVSARKFRPDPESIEPKAVDVAPPLDEMRKHLGADGPVSEIAVWVSETDPEILFVGVRLDRPRELRASAGGDSIKMKPVGPADERLFAVAMRHTLWARATTNIWVSYRDADGTNRIIGPKNAAGIPKSPVWRGPEAPPAPPTVEKLTGTLRKYDVPSEALGGTRKVIVYLPPGYDPEKPLSDYYKGTKPSVVYFADGHVVESMANLVEALIVSGQMRHVILVGAPPAEVVVRPPDLGPAPKDANANDPFADDARAMEYLEPDESMRESHADTFAVHTFMFDRHFKFFADELPKWAEQKLGVNSNPQERVLAGFSNSASFVVTLARRRPAQYAGVIANSVAGSRPPTGEAAKEKAFAGLAEGAAPPRFVLSSGTWETHFRQSTDLWADYMKANGAECRRMTVVGGHDQRMWELALAEGLPWMLPPREGRHRPGNDERR